MAMRFRLVPAVFLLAALLAGCDSTRSSGPLREIEGTYRLDELMFTASGVQPADVGSRLVGAGTRLTIFGDGGLTLLTTQIEGEGTRRTDLRVSSTRGRVTFEAATADDRADLQRLLLPERFTLFFDAETPRDLATTGDGVSATVDLNAYDPTVYNAGLRAVPGLLRIRFSPVAR